MRLAPAPAQFWGTLLSIVALLVAGVAFVVEFQTAQPGVKNWALLLAACYLLLTVVLIASVILPNGYLRATEPVGANLEGVVELLAYSADLDVYKPEDTIEVTLYWRPLRSLNQDYKTFIHLTDAEVTTQPTQHDDDPGGDFTPTTRWMVGELVPDKHSLSLPADLPPGRYHIWADMYEFTTVRNLKVLSAKVATDGNRVLLGEIRVVAK